VISTLFEISQPYQPFIEHFSDILKFLHQILGQAELMVDKQEALLVCLKTCVGRYLHVGLCVRACVAFCVRVCVVLCVALCVRMRCVWSYVCVCVNLVVGSLIWTSRVCIL
jgi:hypothetical protein